MSHGAGVGFLTYDQIIAAFGSDVVSYWKFEGNGTDEQGFSNATITGNPETDVETIVDFDLVSEGSTSDGTVISWSGGVGEYAEVTSNAAYKTSSGTIIINHQHDRRSEKAILLASDSGSAAGGFSIEVNTDGSSRAYLRDSTGVIQQVVGQPLDVDLDKVYTTIFRWGAPGLSLDLYGSAGLLIRHLTSVLSTGMIGNTSAIRFGAWHTDTGHHSGPYGRVTWMSRRITDSEAATLALARTIVHQGTVIPTADLPYAGKFYGNHHCQMNPNNYPMNGSDKNAQWFFFAPRSGQVDRFRWNRRSDTPDFNYSLGDGGQYTCQVWPADPQTKLAIKTGTPLARITNYRPGHGPPGNVSPSPALTGGTSEWPVMTFTEVNAPLVKGQPYCFEWDPTGTAQSANFVSCNGMVMYVFTNEAGPNTYATNFMPDFITGTVTSGREFPFPVLNTNEGGVLRPSWRKGFGDPSIGLRYTDGVWIGAPCIVPGTTRYANIGGAVWARDLRRVTLANRVVDGVWIRIVRYTGATGNLLIRIADHGTADSAFLTDNGTLMADLTVSQASLYEISGTGPTGQPEKFNEVTTAAPYDQAHWHFVAFPQRLTFVVGRAYSCRFSKPSGTGNYGWRSPYGVDHQERWSPVSATWAAHEANHEVPWQDQDSRGTQESLNSGATWDWHDEGPLIRSRGPILYRCVLPRRRR